MKTITLPPTNASPDRVFQFMVTAFRALKELEKEESKQKGQHELKSKGRKVNLRKQNV